MTYLQPIPALLLAIAAFEVVRLWRSARHTFPWILVLVIGVVFLAAWPPVAWLMCRPFEAMNPPRLYPPAGAGAIVVLASTVYPSCPPIPGPVPAYDTYDRCRYAAWLYTNWRNLPVIASGGKVESTDDSPYSRTMRDELERDGVPAMSISLEENSRSTYENAFYTAALLERMGIHRIVLVTTAYHMPRAEGCFLKQGIDVVPAPCGFRTYYSFHWEQLLPSWEAISWNEDTLHESVGFAWYKLRGRI